MPGLASRMGAGDFEMSEDCLFLNVQSPANALNLPVLVWIHGGGYGAGIVSVQYRLGPFGFLASEEVARRGVANAGLLNQFFALQWVQAYINRFGGNVSMVTISGESARGGLVMLKGMAYGGSLGVALFHSAIAASPYLPRQYAYDVLSPTQTYQAFADHARCRIDSASQSLFDCLVSKDTATLQNASATVTAIKPYGAWASCRSQMGGGVNGRNLLVGNNANEGPLFTPPNITTEPSLRTWLHRTLPEFSDEDVDRALRYYPGSNASSCPQSYQIATNGIVGPSALDQSSLATGQQQHANVWPRFSDHLHACLLARVQNIYAELTFVCPSYWLAEAYSSQGRTAYKYQFSALPGTHASDLHAYFGPLGSVPYLGADLQRPL
ncbi:hypothetical protein E8E12_001315 [Didymella heteroderae]|uniref:Carboxylesterase type B domain-containing protein n=1 Tax=Didymella heteroderae TaxID=1769908 RepID=A0A9P4WGF1_9PLEO|nr:hypothetical protein E8E12_001315 [Didymella heteroderae]